jgi:hypothetical protein
MSVNSHLRSDITNIYKPNTDLVRTNPEKVSQVQQYNAGRGEKSIEEARGLNQIQQSGHTGLCRRSDHRSWLSCNGTRTLMSLGALVPLQVVFALEGAFTVRASEPGPSLMDVFVVAFKVLGVSEAE